MHCAACGLLIETASKVRKGRTVVRFDDQAADVDAMIAAIAELGYTIIEVRSAP